MVEVGDSGPGIGAHLFLNYVLVGEADEADTMLAASGSGKLFGQVDVGHDSSGGGVEPVATCGLCESRYGDCCGDCDNDNDDYQLDQSEGPIRARAVWLPVGVCICWSSCSVFCGHGRTSRAGMRPLGHVYAGSRCPADARGLFQVHRFIRGAALRVAGSKFVVVVLVVNVCYLRDYVGEGCG